MLYYKFNGFEGFKSLFGKRVCGNGNIARQNKILLALIKCKAFLHDDDILNLTDMAQMESLIFKRIERESGTSGNVYGTVYVLGYNFCSSTYKTDSHNGLCLDGSTDFVRILTWENDREKVYKKKAGKLFRSLALETPFGRSLPAEVLNYMCEQFTLKWKAYSASQVDGVELHIDKNFSRIYDSSCCSGDFESCMTDKHQHYFYEDAVKCHAAYLTKGETVIARAILFDKIFDEDGNEYRYLERQYACNGNEIHKQLLVNMLIAQGAIDCYKQVGAGCRDSRLILTASGESLRSKKFHTECSLDEGDVLSYQDTFKWYDYENGVAYNYDEGCLDDDLSTTDNRYSPNGTYDDDDEDENYDDYHDYYTSHDTTEAYRNGTSYSVDEDNLDDFYWVEDSPYGSTYIHSDDVGFCDECEDPFFDGDRRHSSYGVYSELTEQTYCCERCRASAERRWKEDNWVLCADDDEYHSPDEAVYCEELKVYFSDEESLEQAVLEYKKENYDFCEDTQTYEDPDETYYSQSLEKFFLYEENMIQAELDAANGKSED